MRATTALFEISRLSLLEKIIMLAGYIVGEIRSGMFVNVQLNRSVFIRVEIAEVIFGNDTIALKMKFEDNDEKDLIAALLFPGDIVEITMHPAN